MKFSAKIYHANLARKMGKRENEISGQDLLCQFGTIKSVKPQMKCSVKIYRDNFAP